MIVISNVIYLATMALMAWYARTRYLKGKAEGFALGLAEATRAALLLERYAQQVAIERKPLETDEQLRARVREAFRGDPRGSRDAMLAAVEGAKPVGVTLEEAIDAIDPRKNPGPK